MPTTDRYDDVDLVIVMHPDQADSIKKLASEKEATTGRKLHPVRQTPEDFHKNLRKADKVIVSAVRHGLVLYGHEIHSCDRRCLTKKTRYDGA